MSYSFKPRGARDHGPLPDNQSRSFVDGGRSQTSGGPAGEQAAKIRAAAAQPTVGRPG